MEKRKDS